MSLFRDLRSGARRAGIPATIGLMAVPAATFVLFWLTKSPLIHELVFSAATVAQKPWTLITYPFVSDDPIGVLISCFMLYWFAGAVERECGSQRLLTFFFGGAASFSLLFWMAGMAIPVPTQYGMFLPLSVITVIWCTIFPNSVIQFMLLFPLQGKWVAWITAAFVLFGVGHQVPLLGVVACVPLAAAYFVASNRAPGLSLRPDPEMTKAKNRQREADQVYFDDVRRRESERQEREQLKRLFERSLMKDPDDKGDDEKR